MAAAPIVPLLSRELTLKTERALRTWRTGHGCSVDHLHDAARARLDQNGFAIYDGVAIGRRAETLRHVVKRYAFVSQDRADDDVLRNGV